MVEKWLKKWLKINIRTAGLIHSEKPKTKNNNDEHYLHCVFGILCLIFWLLTLHSLLHFTSKFRKRSFMSITLFAYFLKSKVLFYRYLDYLQTQIHF